MPKKQGEFLEDSEKVEAPTSQTYSAAGSMLQKNPKTKEAVDSLEIEETVKTEETLESKDLNSTDKTSEYSKDAEKSSISETKSSRSSEDPSDDRETRSDKSFTKSGDLDSNLCIIKGSSGWIEKRDDKEGSNSGQQNEEKDRMPKKQSEFDEKAEDVDSAPPEGPKTNLGQLEKIASKGKSEGQFISRKELKKWRETVKQLMLANSYVKAIDKIYEMEKSSPPEYCAMFSGWKASIMFDAAKETLMDDWPYKPEDRDPLLCNDMLKNSLMHAERAVEKTPNCLEFLVGLAQTLQLLKAYQRVKEVCDRALSLKPTEFVDDTGGSVKKKVAKMQIKALEKIKKSAEEELSKANANAMDSGNSESRRIVGSAEASTSDGMPARSRRNMN